jgi:hypothetical protein
MASHMMIDIETLDTRPSAVVFQVGVVVFEDALMQKAPKVPVMGQRRFDLDILPQIMAGRTVDPETVKWWQTQKAPFMPHHKDYAENMFKDINQMMGDFGVGYVWSNSPSFDAVIMRSLRESMGILHEFPSFRSDMDFRTLKNLCRMNKLVEFEPKETKHDALQDALDQTDDLLTMMIHLRNVFDVWNPSNKG